MELILIKPVRKLGKIGEVVKVAGGYARNYLIPNGYAIIMNSDSQKEVSSLMQDLENKNSQKMTLAQKVAEELEGKFITFIRQTSDDGKLFGSVSVKDILKQMKEASKEDFSILNIELDSKPIKNVGIHGIEINLHPEVQCKIYLNIARSESEAQELLKNFNNSNTNTISE